MYYIFEDKAKAAAAAAAYSEDARHDDVPGAQKSFPDHLSSDYGFQH